MGGPIHGLIEEYLLLLQEEDTSMDISMDITIDVSMDNRMNNRMDNRMDSPMGNAVDNPIRSPIENPTNKQSLNHIMFIIGDPKQSIYRFRGADVFAYQLAKDTIENNNPSNILSTSHAAQ